jgi:hypothetical protein
MSRTNLWKTAAVLAVLAACRPAAPEVSAPTDRYLVHVFEPWQLPPPELESPTRTAPATILVFSRSGEYVEHSCYVIEDLRDKALSISAGDGHTVVVGRWTRDGARLHAVRQGIYRFVPFVGPGPDPLCKQAELTYRISGGSVVLEKERFEPSTRLQSPDWDAYVNDAKSSKIRCENAR